MMSAFKLDTMGGRRAIDRVFVEGIHKWEELSLMIRRNNRTKNEIILVKLETER